MSLLPGNRVVSSIYWGGKHLTVRRNDAPCQLTAISYLTETAELEGSLREGTSAVLAESHPEWQKRTQRGDVESRC
jgi:hypothetical protein